MESFTCDEIMCVQCKKLCSVTTVESSKPKAMAFFRKLLDTYTCVTCKGELKRPERKSTAEEIVPSEFNSKDDYLWAKEQAKFSGQLFSNDRGRILGLAAGAGSTIGLLRAQKIMSLTIVFEGYEDIPNTIAGAYDLTTGAPRDRNWESALNEARRMDFVGHGGGIIGTMSDWEKGNSLVFDNIDHHSIDVYQDDYDFYSNMLKGLEFHEPGMDSTIIHNMMKLGGNGGYTKWSPRTGNPTLSDETLKQQERDIKETVKALKNSNR